MTPRCRYDRERELYLNDGEPCKTDDYGDPTHHCKARRSCGNHIGRGELTCARCIGRTRADLRRITLIAPLLMTRALGSGVNSEAANLAGPGADLVVFETRRTISRTWIYGNIHQSARDWCDDEECIQRHFKTSEGDRWHKRGIENALADLLEDDDVDHPFIVLTRWQLMFSEYYGHPLATRLTVSGAGAYLERTLGRIAQDDEQDWPLFAREIRHCRDHLEDVLQNSARAERGEICPDCKTAGHVVRLQREYAHYCKDPLCEQQYHPSIVIDRATGEALPDTTHDRWVCPRDREHWRSHEDYQRWIEERTGA